MRIKLAVALLCLNFGMNAHAHPHEEFMVEQNVTQNAAEEYTVMESLENLQSPEQVSSFLEDLLHQDPALFEEVLPQAAVRFPDAMNNVVATLRQAGPEYDDYALASFALILSAWEGRAEFNSFAEELRLANQDILEQFAALNEIQPAAGPADAGGLVETGLPGGLRLSGSGN